MWHSEDKDKYSSKTAKNIDGRDDGGERDVPTLFSSLSAADHGVGLEGEVSKNWEKENGRLS